jgi:thiamine biosynthesis protein ThiI
MHPPGAETVLVRYGDASTKSHGVRHRMETQLVENVEALLTDRAVDARVEQHATRPRIRAPTTQIQRAAEVAADAFGVVSTSPALSVQPNPDAICDALADAARACYDGGTFAVEARRAGDSFPLTSQEVQEVGGQAVWDAVADAFEPAVDLTDPDLTFNVEIRAEEAFVFFEHVSGPGGLPLGTQAPVVALVSGGIDSPVAAYEMLRRGSPIYPVYVDLGDYGGPDHRARATETVRTLARYAPNFEMPFRVVPGGETVEHIADSLDRGRMLAFRRFCLRVGEVVASDTGAVGVATGEAIGQKSSQTLRNLGTTDPVTELPVFRPLLTMDKSEITERARDIGTFDDSTIPAGCDRFAPAQAETGARLDDVRAAEPDDLAERARRAVEDAELVEIRG